MKKNLSLLVLTLVAFSFATANAAGLHLTCKDADGKKVASLVLRVNEKLLAQVSVSDFKKHSKMYEPAFVSFRFDNLADIFADHSLDLNNVITQDNVVSSGLLLEELRKSEDRNGLAVQLSTHLLEQGDGPYEDEVYQLVTLRVQDFATLGYQWKKGAKKVSTVSVPTETTHFATLSYDEGGMGYGDEIKLLCKSSKISVR